MIVDSIVESKLTGKTYSELKTSIPLQGEGKGRLFMYRNADSTNASLQLNIGIVKNRIHCVVDDDVYWLLWEVFMYRDMTASTHEISCGGRKDVHFDTDFWSGKRHYKRGSQKLEVTVQENQVLYVRIDIINGKPTPVLIDTELAKTQISELPIQTGELHMGQIE